VLSVTKFSSLEELKAEDTTDKRSLLGLKAKDNSWFKSIAHGEYIGKIWLESLTDLEGKALKANYEELMKWINE
jgi:hypothetical protein